MLKRYNIAQANNYKINNQRINETKTNNHNNTPNKLKDNNLRPSKPKDGSLRQRMFDKKIKVTQIKEENQWNTSPKAKHEAESVNLTAFKSIITNI